MIDRSNNNGDQLVRIGTVAQLTGLPISFIRRLADEGLLPVCRHGSGRHRRFPRAETIRRARELMPRPAVL